MLLERPGILDLGIDSAHVRHGLRDTRPGDCRMLSGARLQSDLTPDSQRPPVCIQLFLWASDVAWDA